MHSRAPRFTTDDLSPTSIPLLTPRTAMADTSGEPVRISIQSHYVQIIETFRRLSEAFSTASEDVVAQLPQNALEDQRGYFQLWAGNNGAHRYGCPDDGGYHWLRNNLLINPSEKGEFLWTTSYDSLPTFTKQLLSIYTI